MQKLTYVTPDTGEMTIYLEGWYLASTEAGDHVRGLDDVVKGCSPFPMPAPPQYPADALCCGTFWLKEDFLTVDEQLTEEPVGQALEMAEDSHDADIGQEHLRYAIDAVKRT